MALATDYPEFRLALRELVRAVITRSSPELLDVRQGAVPRMRPPDRIDWEHVTVFDGSHLVGRVVDQWAEGAAGWPELDRVMAVAREDDDLHYAFLTDAVGAPLMEEHYRHWFSYALRNFFYDLFATAGPVAWANTDPTFDDLYKRTVESVRTRKRRTIYWAPLYNCELPDVIEPQPFGSLAIEAPTASDLAAFAGPLIFEPMTLVMRFPRHFLRLTTEEAIKGPEFSGDQNVFRRAALAVRLVIGGYVRVREVFIRPVPGYLRGLGQPWNIIASSTETWWDRTRVQPDQLGQIARVWNQIPQLETNFPIPLRRYLLMSERLNVEDRLIDAVKSD